MTYMNVVEVESAISNLAGAYPSLCNLVTLPNLTVEGRTSRALRISNGGFGTRDAVMMIGGVHAREWGSCEILVNFATDLLKAFSTNAGLAYGGKTFTAGEVQAIMNSVEFVIFPLVNADGRFFSQQHDAAILNGWRKNRNPASATADPATVGVDINRNYDFLWDFATKMAPSAPGASADPAAETFHGTAAFSEPETRNVKWLLDSVPRIRWFIDVHSYSELILYNWGVDQNQTTDPTKNFRNPAFDGQRGVKNDAYSEFIPVGDEQVAAALANKMRDGILAVRAKNYTAEPSFALYPTSGASDDYAYARNWLDPSKSKVYGYVVEWGTSFHPAWSEMELIIDDVTSGLLEFCRWAPCAGGVKAITSKTAKLAFVNVPANTQTARAAVFNVQSCDAVTLQVTAGPTRTSGSGNFGLPLGGIVSLPAAATATDREVRIWVSYQAGAASTTAAGNVTVSCPQTSQQWTIPITANAIAKPSVASMLVLDRSGSMDFPSGLPGKKRIDVLHEAAPSFVALLGDQDGVGIVAFDHNANLSMAVTKAGPLGFGAGRAAANATISGHLTNPAGATSIGDGVELAYDTLATTTGYDQRAVVVLTDGDETAAKYISDIASKITDRVYAIGLGTASQLNPVGLSKLVKNTGGYLMLTGPLTASEQFRLTKYYLQILSSVTNSQIIVDPDGYLAKGDVIRVPFEVNEADNSVDVVLLSPYRTAINFEVETPTGDVIDQVSVGTLLDSAFVREASLDAYRVSLPAIWPSHSAHAGTWYARLTIGRSADQDSTNRLRPSEHDRDVVAAHGVPFAVTVQTQSALVMTASTLARKNTPPSAIDHEITLRQLDIPLDTPCRVDVEATDPSGTVTTFSLPPVDAGIFADITTASVAGVYTFRYIAHGLTFSGAQFTREQTRTVAVWQGGDDEPPRSDPHDSVDCCHLMECILHDQGVQQLLKRYEIDAASILKCLRRDQ
jgi:murein tripeptide amidase MpaA